MEKDLISILVPVYNIRNYIGECLDSLLAQTYRNIEIILVDNGSDDGSYEICQEYAAKDSRIRLFRAGVRQQYIARNKTVEEIQGKYYCFVDGDDYVSVNYVQKLYEVISKYDVDMSVCGFTAMVECRDIRFDVDHQIRLIDNPGELRGNIVCKLYRTDVFKSVRFDNVRMGCDANYSSKIFKISTKAAMCGYNLYANRSYISSVTRLTPNKEFFRRLDVCIKEKNEKDFCNYVEKCIQIISHRQEEQLFHNELNLLQKRILLAKQNSITTNPEHYQKLLSMIESSKVGLFKSFYLKLKHIYTSNCAKFRRMTNYHCRLD